MFFGRSSASMNKATLISPLPGRIELNCARSRLATGSLGPTPVAAPNASDIRALRLAWASVNARAAAGEDGCTAGDGRSLWVNLDLRPVRGVTDRFFIELLRRWPPGAAWLGSCPGPYD